MIPHLGQTTWEGKNDRYNQLQIGSMAMTATIQEYPRNINTSDTPFSRTIGG
jgi:hypothetical protein